MLCAKAAALAFWGILPPFQGHSFRDKHVLADGSLHTIPPPPILFYRPDATGGFEPVLHVGLFTPPPPSCSPCETTLLSVSF